jgi:hypothetical protein
VISSKDVFAKRKEGKIDEAYQMVTQLIKAPQPDDWDIKAFGWCLIDLIKRDVAANQMQNIPQYKQQLVAISGPALDEVLAKGQQYAISLCNPNHQLLKQAKLFSQDEKYDQSIAIYKNLILEGETDSAVHTNLGWELYKLSKKLLSQPPLNLGKIKALINDYLKLNIEKPSVLHSRVLQNASKCGAEENFNMLAFTRVWGLKNLSNEDFKRYINDDGKEFPSLAEKVIQQAVKRGIKASDIDGVTHVLPFLDSAIIRHKDNVWLIYYKAKALLLLDKAEDALAPAIDITKDKPNDFWSWELLGDILLNTVPEKSFSCYCKSLLSSNDINFTSKVKLKFAKILIQKEEFAGAKRELNEITEFKEKLGYKIPEEIESFRLQPWFQTTQASTSNIGLYKAHSKQAEEILFSNLPWIQANVGEKYTIPGKENKPKRKLFLSTPLGLVETSVSNAKFNFDAMEVGSAIQVKCEHKTEKPFQIFTIELRQSNQIWDAIPEKIGIVDHINKEKKLLHFIVGRNCDSVIPFANTTEHYKEGDSIAVKLCEYQSKIGKKFRVVTNNKTTEEPSSSIKKLFSEHVNVDHGMGFTSDDIFIPPLMITKNGILNGDYLTGVAVLNYNKKRSTWGWKALSVKK